MESSKNYSGSLMLPWHEYGHTCMCVKLCGHFSSSLIFFIANFHPICNLVLMSLDQHANENFINFKAKLQPKILILKPESQYVLCKKDMIFPCSLVPGLSQFHRLFSFWFSLKKLLERTLARSLLSPGFRILSAPLSGARPEV